MADATSTLKILVEMQDNASAAIASLGGSVSNSFDQIAQKAKQVGEGMVVVGGAITGVLGYMVDQASKDQAANEVLNTALQALQKTAQANLANKQQDNQQTQLLTAQQKNYEAQINNLSFAMDHLTGKNKDFQAIREKDTAQIDLLQGKLAAVNERLQEHSDLMANATANVGDEMNAVQALVPQMENLGFSDDEVTQGIASLLPHTKNLQGAMKDLGVAADLARMKHEDLGTATQQLGMLLEGGGRAAKQLGIQMKDTATPTEALAQVEQMAAGQAQAFAGTFAGQMDVMKAKQEDLSAALGQKLIPMLTTLVEKVNSVISKVQAWVSEHPALVENIMKATAVIGALLLVGGTLITLLGTLALAIGALSAPILIIIGVITGLIAIITSLILWHQQLYDLVKKVWSDIKDVIQGAGETIKNYWGAWMENLQTGWRNAWTGMKDFVAGIWNGISSAVKGGVNVVIGAINDFIKGIDSLHINIPSVKIGNTTIGGQSIGFNIPTIPTLGSGGIVTDPTLALIGEAGPEAVIPLSGSNAAGGTIININIQGGIFPADTSSIKRIGDMLARQVNTKLKLRTV